jgi:hypothetical protein
MMMLCAPKWLLRSQLVLGKSALGVPNLLVSTFCAPFLTSAGTEPSPRDQNQTRSSVGVRSSTYHPPPALLNAGPYDKALLAATPQPALPFTAELQSVCLVVLIERLSLAFGRFFDWRKAYPSIARLAGIVQPALVCRVTEFGPASLTPSRMSTSPLAGQFVSATSQAAVSRLVRLHDDHDQSAVSTHQARSRSLEACGGCQILHSGLETSVEQAEAETLTSNVRRVRLVGLDADAHTAGVGRLQDCLRVRAHDHRVPVSVGQVVFQRCSLIDIGTVSDREHMLRRSRIRSHTHDPKWDPGYFGGQSLTGTSPRHTRPRACRTLRVQSAPAPG